MIARSLDLVVSLVVTVATILAGCDPDLVRCVPGASVACHCDESPGGATCDGEGRYGTCVCSSTCREGTLIACRCEDDRVGLQTCLTAGDRTPCVCEPRCVEGEMALCSCGESLDGRVTCVDGALTACDCRVATCVPDSTRECVCSGGALSVRRCVGRSFGACECSDAPVVTPPIDAGVLDRCAPAPSVPTPLEGLSPPGTWSHPVDSPPVLIDAREDGYVVVTRTRAVLLDREGTELARYTSDLDIVAAALLDEGGVVIADRGRLRVLDDALAVRATHLLATACLSVVDVGCGRVLCAEGGTVTSYELATGERRVSPLSLTGTLLRTFGEDLVIGGGSIVLALPDGSSMARSPRFEPPWTPFGPGAGVVGREGAVMDLTRCAEPTLDPSAPCAEVVGSLPLGASGAPRDGDAAGFFYTIDLDVAVSRWSILRWDVRASLRLSMAVTSLSTTQFPRAVAHDPWGRRVLLSIDPCGFGECMRFVTTASYEP